MRTPLTLLFIALGLLALAGCNTFERRAKDKAAAFSVLSPDDQARLQKKIIRVGDTFDLVYIALGTPDEKRQSTKAGGQTTTWIYNRYWQEYQGEAYGGVVQRVARDPKTGATSVYYEPVFNPVYAPRKQAVMRVDFADGKVTVIEQPKP